MSYSRRRRFLNDFQVQQSKEATTKAKAERDGAFGLIDESRIVELKLGQICLQVFVIRSVDRIEPAEHHRMNFLETGQGRGRNPRVRKRIAHFNVFWALNVGGKVAGLAQFELIADVWLGLKLPTSLTSTVLPEWSSLT